MGLQDLIDAGAPVECSCEESFYGTQRDVMGEVVDHLVQEHNLFDVIEPPVQPKQARKNVLISEKGVRIQQYHPEKRNIQGEYELVTGHFLNTNYSKESKERYLDSLAEGCGVKLKFSW